MKQQVDPVNDLIVVLAAGVQLDGTLPLIPQERVRCAVELWRSGEAPYLLMSGKWSFLLRFTPARTEAQAMAAYAQQLGVPAEAILFEEQSNDTISEAYWVKQQVLLPRHWRRLTVVTSAYHMPRTEYIFRKVLGAHYIIHFVAAEHALSRREHAKRHRVERRLFRMVKYFLDRLPEGDDRFVGALLTKRDRQYKRFPFLRFLLRLLVEGTY